MRVPERPADLERLWAAAEPLAGDELPEWLSVEDASRYRRVAAAAAGEQREALEEAGLIVDETGVYLEDPSTEPIWSRPLLPR